MGAGRQRHRPDDGDAVEEVGFGAGEPEGHLPAVAEPDQEHPVAGGIVLRRQHLVHDIGDEGDVVDAGGLGPGAADPGVPRVLVAGGIDEDGRPDDRRETGPLFFELRRDDAAVEEDDDGQRRLRGRGRPDEEVAAGHPVDRQRLAGADPGQGRPGVTRFQVSDHRPSPGYLIGRTDFSGPVDVPIDVRIR